MWVRENWCIDTPHASTKKTHTFTLKISETSKKEEGDKKGNVRREGGSDGYAGRAGESDKLSRREG